MNYCNPSVLISCILLIFCFSCQHIDIKNTSVEDVKELIKTDYDYSIIDVRTPKEFKEGSVPGASNIDVKDDNFLLEIEKLNKNEKYIVYCRSGKRSSKAYRLMTKAGFKNLLNMEGGYLAYAEEK